MAVQRIYPHEATPALGKHPRRIEDEPRVGPGRRGFTREEVRASQRRRVLRATVEVVGRRGFAEAPVADLVTHAGISRKTFYELFSGKEECVLTIFDAAIGKLRAFVEKTYQEDVTPHGRIDSVVDALFKWVIHDPDLARLCVLEVPGSGVAGRKRVASTITWLTGVMTDWLGDVDVPELLPELLVGGIHQMVVHRLITDPAALPPLATDLTEVWLDVERWPSTPSSST